MTLTAVRVRLLGPVEIVVDNRYLALERRQERCLLAVLLVEHGKVVSVDRLATLLWDSAPPERFRALLHTQVSRVRAALRKIGADGWLRTVRGGYLMRVPSEHVDAHRFRRYVEQARLATDPGERAMLLRAGLDLWRGPALADVGSELLRQRLVGELDELRLAAVEEWLAALLDVGRHGEAAAEVSKLVAEHPLREGLVELSLRALAATGRSAEALRSFEEYRLRLAEETGLDPGQSLLRARLAILRGELGSGDRGIGDPAPAGGAMATGLPGGAPTTGLTGGLSGGRAGGRAGEAAAGDAGTGGGPAGGAVAGGGRGGAETITGGAAEGVDRLERARGYGGPSRGGFQQAGYGAARGVPGGQRRGGVEVEPQERPRPGQLPHNVVDFTGRATEADRIISALASASTAQNVMIFAISGQAGVGKTALAVHVAHRVRAEYPDGQLYVNLRGSEDRPREPSDVLAQFLRALGAAGAAIPESPEERAAMYRSLLADRRVLVVLDNAVDERQIRNLIPGTAGAAVLVTSRRRLAGLPSGSTLTLDVLTDDQARVLLGGIVGDERIRAEPTFAAELVRLCAGLPLALRIVGARLAARPHWLLANLVDRLAAEHRRLDELSHDDLAVRASLGLSYRGLTEIERRLMRRLALLEAPDFAGWVATAVLDADYDETLAALDRLVEVNLVTVAGSDRAGQVRYRFHDLVRLYGRERAATEELAAERTAALVRALGGWLVLTQQARAAYHGDDFAARLRAAPRWDPDQATLTLATELPMDWLLAERPSLIAGIRQAASVGLGPTCWELTAAAAAVLHANNYIDDLVEAADWALVAARAARSTFGEAVALTEVGSALMERGQLTKACLVLADAARLFDEAGCRHGHAQAEYCLAWASRIEGHWAAAQVRYRRAVSVFEEYHDRFGHALSLIGIARTHLALGEFEQASGALRDASALGEQGGTLLLSALVTHALGELYLGLGDYRQAERMLLNAIAIARKLESKSGESAILVALGQLALKTDQWPEARAYLQRALSMSRAHCDGIMESRALHGLGRLCVMEGDRTAAIEILKDALASSERNTQHARTVTILDELAAVYEASGDEAAAAKARRQAAVIRDEARVTNAALATRDLRPSSAAPVPHVEQ